MPDVWVHPESSPTIPATMPSSEIFELQNWQLHAIGSFSQGHQNTTPYGNTTPTPLTDYLSTSQDNAIIKISQIRYCYG